MFSSVLFNLISSVLLFGIFIAAFPDRGNWAARWVDNYDVLYYWETNSNYTYDEAKTICLRRNMPSRIFLDEIVYGITDQTEYWAPHVFHLPKVVRVLESGPFVTEEFSGSNKGVICTAIIKGAVLMHENGTTTHILDSPIPSYCYPQNAQSNDENVIMCMLIIQKYEL